MKSESENKQGLTIERLRTLKGYENVSEDQASGIILSIKKLAVLLCEHLLKLKKAKQKEEVSSETLNETEETAGAKIIKINLSDVVSDVEFRKQA
jgi:hypothetical protein